MFLGQETTDQLKHATTMSNIFSSSNKCLGAWVFNLAWFAIFQNMEFDQLQQ